MTKKHISGSGFTLIELLVVTTIIIVLATIGLVSFTAAGKTARDGKRKADIETVRQALVLYRQQHTSTGYPTVNYSTLVGTSYLTNPSDSYLSQPTPTDPGTYAYTYTSTTGTTFCLCAQMENTTKGNSNGTNCSFVANSTHYCVTN